MSAWLVIVTIAALGFYIWTGLRVGSARTKYGIPAPAITGHPDFERVFRVQMNTLEWLPIFLPSLWMFAAYWDSRIAALLGVAWIIGRVMYALGYTKAADQRSMGFLVQGVAVLILLIGTLVGAIMSFFA